MTPQEFFDLMLIFGMPDFSEQGEIEPITDAYLKPLGNYSSDTLRRAADDLLATRKIRKFPLPAECMQACRDAQEELAIEAKRENDGKRRETIPSDPWSPERVKRADAMMDSSVGREAANEGWIISLHDFCREQGRLPNGFETVKVRIAALARKAERERRERLFGGNPKLIQSVARAMETKASRLSAIAHADAAQA
jgi:hypothetical protein